MLRRLETVSDSLSRLRVEYKGVISSLGSPAEIAAWIEERKKRYPTKQRIKEIQEQKERQIAEARQRRDEAMRLLERARATRADQTQDAVKPIPPPPSKREKKATKMEKLLKKMKEQDEKLAMLEAKLASREEKDPKVENSQGAGRLNGAENSSPAIKVEDNEDAVSVKEHSEELAGTRGDLAQPSDSATLGSQPADELKAESQSVSSPSRAVDLVSSESSALDSGSDSDLSLSSQSSSSSSSDNEAPTELPVLREGPEAAAASNPGLTTTTDLANATPTTSSDVCRRFARTGTCTHQQRRGFCRYRHVQASGAADAVQQPGSVAADKKASNAQPTRPPTEKPQGRDPSQGKGAQEKRGRQKPKRKSLYQRVSVILYYSDFCSSSVFSSAASPFCFIDADVWFSVCRARPRTRESSRPGRNTVSRRTGRFRRRRYCRRNQWRRCSTSLLVSPLPTTDDYPCLQHPVPWRGDHHPNEHTMSMNTSGSVDSNQVQTTTTPPQHA